jgi:hypothetical protein
LAAAADKVPATSWRYGQIAQICAKIASIMFRISTFILRAAPPQQFLFTVV